MHGKGISGMGETHKKFGPRSTPVWVAGVMGLAFFVGGVFVAGYAVESGDTPTMIIAGSLGLLGGSFGAWMLLNGWRISRLRAEVTADTLRIVAQRGRGLWLPHPLADVTVTWAEVQGFNSTSIPNRSAPGGRQGIYVLYTSRGDFNLNDVQWNNLNGLLKEITRFTGREAGVAAAERSAAQAEFQAGKRGIDRVMRVSSWVATGCGVVGAIMLLISLLAHC
jgi:hypothetical protein